MARRSYHYAEQRNGDHYDQEQPTYESIDVHVHRPAESNNQYGTFHERRRELYSESSEGGYLDNNFWRSNVRILREEPVTLSDGTNTIVQRKLGIYAMLVIALFTVMFPPCICVFPLLPFLFTKYSRWMKDTEHFDSISNNFIGVYRRGCIDGPRKITFYREPNANIDEQQENEETFSDTNYRQNSRGAAGHRRHSSQRHDSRQFSLRDSDSVKFKNGRAAIITNQPIKLHIVFKDKPVLLPDGETTIVRKRIGLCNMVSAIVTLLLGCVCFPLPILCFLMPCCKDVEHIHPRTHEIVGIYYRCML